MLLALLACVRLVPEPVLSAAVDIDRGALPAMSLQVFPISTGSLPARMVFAEGGGPDVPIVSYAVVLNHPTAGVVVIDPGFGQRTVDAPHEAPGRATVRTTGLVMGTPLIAQLTESVDRILVTHMHIDHAGAIEDFPDAMVQITAAEWEFGSRRRPIRAVIPAAGQSVRAVEPLTFADGAYGSFDAHSDVLGDGSLIALPTFGHTPGHTAFLVNLPGGSFLLTGDAAWVDEHLSQPALKGRMARGLIEVDGEANGEALWRLRALSEAIPGVVILTGHDPDNLTRVQAGRVYR
ncbi:MAG: N-acyl homoserine lactone hydrolase [Myxococcota bacterium]|jgi:N-acyl homoserine lactone hydrolase